MFAPVLITLPRTGSSLICQLLGNICKQTSDYKNTLQEFYTMEDSYINTYDLATVFNERIVVVKDYHEVEITNPPWFGDRDNMRRLFKERVEMLHNNEYNYMLKLFVWHLRDPIIKSYIDQRYQPVYLERRNLLRQFLSSLYISGNKKFTQYHFNPGDQAQGYDIPFTYGFFTRFKKDLAEYNDYKTKHPGRVIVYENFLELGGNEQALGQILGIDCANVKPANVKTIPTPYSTGFKHMLNNSKDWQKHKDEITDYFNNNQHTA